MIELSEHEKDLITVGKKVRAIKSMRDRLGITLQESLETFKRYEIENELDQRIRDYHAMRQALLAVKAIYQEAFEKDSPIDCSDAVMLLGEWRDDNKDLLARIGT